LTTSLTAITVQCAVSIILLLVISIYLLNNLSPTCIDVITVGNTNDDCCPQVETQTVGWDLNYHAYNAVFFAIFFAYVCLVTFLLYLYNKKCEDTNTTLSPAMEARFEEEDNALSKICSDSVYSYFVTEDVFGWFVALVTISVQFGILAVSSRLRKLTSKMK
jgi:hypothetical protein